MRSPNRLLLFAFVTLIITVPFCCAQDDQKGSQDHPLVTRMPGYYISNYEVKEFDAYDQPTPGGKHYEGKKYTISYSRKDDAAPISMLPSNSTMLP